MFHKKSTATNYMSNDNTVYALNPINCIYFTLGNHNLCTFGLGIFLTISFVLSFLKNVWSFAPNITTRLGFNYSKNEKDNQNRRKNKWNGFLHFWSKRFNFYLQLPIFAYLLEVKRNVLSIVKYRITMQV